MSNQTTGTIEQENEKKLNAQYVINMESKNCTVESFHFLTLLRTETELQRIETTENRQ